MPRSKHPRLRFCIRGCICLLLGILFFGIVCVVGSERANQWTFHGYSVGSSSAPANSLSFVGPAPPMVLPNHDYYAVMDDPVVKVRYYWSGRFHKINNIDIHSRTSQPVSMHLVDHETTDGMSQS